MGTQEEPLRVLELFCGIGGMHYALKKSKLHGSVVCAMDINPETNAIYKHNFPTTPLQQRNIESLSVLEVNYLNVNAIFMSPPCQPFTCNGLCNDVNDPRCSPLIHICNLLTAVGPQIKYLLMENVVGFETSEARNILIEKLEDSGFGYREFLLSPSTFGIPNSRTRYFLLAARGGVPLQCGCSEQLHKGIPDVEDDEEMRTISEYLDKNVSDEYFIPERILMKYGSLFDIVNHRSLRSCCFTRSYARFVEGTGSVLHTNDAVSVDEAYSSTNLSDLKLRYFTPMEVSRLMGFPQEFEFPISTRKRVQYKSLGNSLNVIVVSKLIKVLGQRNSVDS